MSRPERAPRPGRLAVAAALLLLALAAPASPARAAIEVRGDDGRVVRLAQPARRIVSLAPHLTELLFALGAGDRVVGTVQWSDHPREAQRIPRVGDATLLDMEAVAALRPDLVVVWRGGTSARQLQRLAALGVPVFASESRRLAHVAASLRDLGRLTGREAQAQARAAAFEAELDGLRSRFAGRRELTVFYQIWHRPLMTVNGEHLISEALAVCGARNVFADLPALTPTVSEEAVLSADPEAIVTGSVDPAGPDNLDRWRALRSLRATRHGALITVDPDTLHRQSERVLDGVRELCARLDAVRRTAAPERPAPDPASGPRPTTASPPAPPASRAER